MAHGGTVPDCFAACVGAGAGCGCMCARALAPEEERKALVTGSSQVVRLSDLVVQDAGLPSAGRRRVLHRGVVIEKSTECT